MRISFLLVDAIYIYSSDHIIKRQHENLRRQNKLTERPHIERKTRRIAKRNWPRQNNQLLNLFGIVMTDKL